MIAKESLFLALLTGLSYLIAYFYKRAYFGYFGVEEAFVDIGISDLLIAAAGLSFLVGSLIYPIMGLPTSLWKFLFGLLLVLRLIILVAIIFIPSFNLMGVNWLTVIMFLLLEALILWEALMVFRHWWKGGDLFSYMQAELDVTVQVNQVSLDQKLATVLGSTFWTVATALVILPPAVGVLAGRYTAGDKDDFSTVMYADSKFILLGTFANGLVLAEIALGQSEQEKWQLTGQTIWVSNEDISGHPFKSEDFSYNLHPSTTYRTSFQEWWNGEGTPLRIELD